MAKSRQTSRMRRTRQTQNSGGRSGEKRGRYARQWSGGRDRPKSYIAPPAYGTLDEVPRDVYERALTEKLVWIQRLINEEYPRGKLEEYARAYAENVGLSPDAVPSYSTMNTWVHRYRSFGLLGLMDSVRRDAGHMRGITRDVAKTATVLRVGGKQGPAAALTQLARMFERETLPTYATLCRYIRRFERDNPHLMVVADEGIAGYKNKFRVAIAGDSYPGGMVLALDSTVTDIWVRVPDPKAPGGWKAVRLVLTVVEDVGARLLVTFNLSFVAVDSGILMSVFRRAVMQEANYPGLLSTGMPRRVIVDKGAEHQGWFKRTMEQHQVEISASQPNSPETNGRVERVIKTISTEVFATMFGYSPTHQRFKAYAPAEWDAKRRLKSLKYEPYRMELPVELLPRVEEVEAEILAWAQLYNIRPHVSLPADDEELRRMIALATDLDELNGGQDNDV